MEISELLGALEIKRSLREVFHSCAGLYIAKSDGNYSTVIMPTPISGYTVACL